MFGMTTTRTGNRWLFIQPARPPEPYVIFDLDQARDLLGGAIDSGMLSRHVYYFVYEYSITYDWPLNAHMRRGDRDVLIRGPVLIYKCDDEGETVNLTDSDIARIEGLWRAARRGENPDSLSLEVQGVI